MEKLKPLANSDCRCECEQEREHEHKRDENCGDQITPTSICNPVGIQTDKIYDQCRDKDCIEDLRVYFTSCDQELVNRAISIKARKSEVIWVFTDIEPVPFNKGCYSIDLRYFFKITLDVYCGISSSTRIEGLASFEKKVILYGAEGNSKVFSSNYKFDADDTQNWQKTNLPKAVVEVVDPICLSLRVADPKHDCCDCDCCCDDDISAVPECICSLFGDRLVVCNDKRKVYVSLGVFSIVRLERTVQLLIHAYNFDVPQKQCTSANENSPCELFERIKFPVDEFFPPEKPHDDYCSC